MRANYKITIYLPLALGLLALVEPASAAAPAGETAVDLAAHRVEVTIAGEKIPVWVFSQLQKKDFDKNGVPTPPASAGLPTGKANQGLIKVLPGNSLRINPYNFLPEPTSVSIPGQALPAVEDGGTPVLQEPVRIGGRIRSLVPETPAYNAGASTPGLRSYSWSNLREGTYLFRSGTHVNVQVPMGLYGVIQKNFAEKAGPSPAQAYDGHPYNMDMVVLISEIDPAQNLAVDTGAYGTSAHPSMIHYRPRYFLVGGKPHSDGNPAPIEFESADIPVLIRFLNAGLETHVPMLLGSHLQLIAEDGNLYPYPREHSAISLPAGKTIDAIFRPASADAAEISGGGKTYPLFDRRMFLSNGTLDFTNGDTVNDTKGMLTAIFVGP